MKALVIIAHGSRREASNDEVRAFSQSVYESVKNEYPLTNTGFLELATPLIPDSLIECIEKGATSIKVMPYFLSAGRHVQEDVPAEVQKVKDMYPEVEIETLSYVGELSNLVSLVSSYVKDAGS